MFKYSKKAEQYMEWAKKMGFCSQCICPWNDGLCECNGSTLYHDKMTEIAIEVNKEHDEWFKQYQEYQDKLEKEEHKRQAALITPEFQKKLNEVMANE